MTWESRVLRGDDPKDVAELFNVPVEACEALANANKPAKKKAARAKKSKK